MTEKACDSVNMCEGRENFLRNYEKLDEKELTPKFCPFCGEKWKDQVDEHSS